jgi:Recombination endonuclease VII
MAGPRISVRKATGARKKPPIKRSAQKKSPPQQGRSGADEARRLARNARLAERNRRRYSEDPAYRDRCLAATRRWYAANKIECNAHRRQRYATEAEGERRHAVWLQKQFGLTPADYAAMLAEQGGVCGICRTEPVDRRLAVDHCKFTRFIRGLLCHNCNLGNGHFNHQPSLLRASAVFMEDALARYARGENLRFVPLPRKRPSKFAKTVRAAAARSSARPLKLPSAPPARRRPRRG